VTVVLELTDLVTAAFARRVSPVAGLRDQADALACACRDIAERFARGGRLLVFGNGAGTTDAQHVAVEFVHPATVGKPSLPALSLAGDAATLLGVAAERGFDSVYAHQVQVLGRPEDIALGLSDDDSVRNGLQAARDQGLLTVALLGPASAGLTVDHQLTVAAEDPHVLKEAHVTAYHLLWELVHVFLDAPDAPAASSGVEQLYPFLYGGGTDAGSTLRATAESVRQKVDEILQLRADVGAAQAAALARCADEVAHRILEGATVLAFGNGGSSTDAQDVAQTLMNPPAGVRAVPALALVNDVAVVTALSNDVGFDVVFARQVKAFGRRGDVAVALSTSGGSQNVLDGLAQAHRLGMLTVGLAGYGGGRMAEASTVDHLFAVPSGSVHRVQEVQTTLTHVLWEAVSHVLAARPQPPQPARG
jgi:D-sedoheptulose 7-phosphate isomerase